MAVMADHGGSDEVIALAQDEYGRGRAGEREIEIRGGIVPGACQPAARPERDDGSPLGGRGRVIETGERGPAAHTRIGIRT